LSGNASGHGSPATDQQWVWLAHIRRTQGRKGEVFAEILTDFPDKFSVRRNLWLVTDPSGAASRPQSEPRAIELVHHWLHKGGIVLHFAGIDSISAAETLIGFGVAIPRTERAPLAEDEAYIGDLIGCTLVDVAGSEPALVGEIQDVDLTAGPTPLLIVRRGSTQTKGAGGEILIPYTKAHLRHLDIEHRRVEMALPEGLVDLNNPM
jgi:16S rRNA processing protein RimM